MANIKVVWYNVVCKCPDWAIAAQCDGLCNGCGYRTLCMHIKSGEYKKYDYDEENETFSFGNTVLDIDRDESEVSQSWIEYLEIDGDVIINKEEDEEGGNK